MRSSRHPISGLSPAASQALCIRTTPDKVLRSATPIASYTFDCGNGQAPTTQTGPTTSCQYPTPGTYRATVTVRDTVGLAGTASVTITSLADAPPVAALTLSKGSINTGQSIVADASGSTDVDNTPVASYRFDCGNGTGSTTQAAARFTCSYPKAGKFAVRVWVTDTGGLTSSISKQLNVKAGK